jgi:hypothetical protein
MHTHGKIVINVIRHLKADRRGLFHVLFRYLHREDEESDSTTQGHAG